jgi:4-amino-4-deoxy-L-arabinose transferase-like glycosyltransferase
VSTGVVTPETARAPVEAPKPRARDRRIGLAAASLVAIIALAAALRFVGIEHALPFGLLNPDEQVIVPRAWHMVHGGGPNPHWFNYPTLVLYLMAPFQAWHDAPSYLDARILVALLGIGAVAATWWLGLRAYGLLAAAVGAGVVAVDVTHVAYSHMAVTDVPLTLGVAAALALMVSGRIELAGVVAGLAMGAKWPGVLLIVPLVVAAWKQWRRLGIAVLLGAVTFVVTSPFVLVEPGKAFHDAWDTQSLHHKGWLGFEHDGNALVGYLHRLWSGMGPVLVIAFAGLVAALIVRRRPDLILASFVLVYFANLLTLQSHFDRFTLPLIAPLGVLAGRIRLLAPVAAVLLVVPLVWSIQRDNALAKTDTRVIAHDWIESHLPRGTKIAAESSTAPLAGFDVIPLELPGPAFAFDPNRNVGRLERRHVRYVLINGLVADRVLAARSSYPKESRFYADLARGAQREYYIRPGGDLSGPWLALYRLSP